MTDMFGGTAPALANPPQFTPEYWQKIPRQTVAVKVHKVTTKDDDNGGSWKEFVVKMPNGKVTRFRRKASEVTQLVMPGTMANLEVVGDELITGLYLPEVKAWAFRMTADDLAEYTREISGLLHAQRLKARQLMLDTLEEAMLLALDDLGLISMSDDDRAFGASTEARDMARHLAIVAIGALESGPQQ